VPGIEPGTSGSVARNSDHRPIDHRGGPREVIIKFLLPQIANTNSMQTSIEVRTFFIVLNVIESNYSNVTDVPIPITLSVN
jgi:hypothetical protein